MMKLSTFVSGLVMAGAAAFSYAKEPLPPVIMQAQINAVSAVQLHNIQGECPEGSKRLTLYYMNRMLKGCWKINSENSTLIDVVDEEGDTGTLPISIFLAPKSGV